MFLKLLKHDFFTTIKRHIPLFILLFLSSAVAGVCVYFGREYPNNPLFTTAKPLAITLYVISVIALFFGSVVLCVLYFRSNLLKDQGYLMNTLPVPSWNLYASKLLISYLMYLINIGTFILSLCITLASFDWFDDVEKFIEIMQIESNMPDSMLIYFVAYMIYYGLYTYALFFFVLIVGYCANGSRDLFAVIAYIAVYMVGQFVNTIVMLLVPVYKGKSYFMLMLQEPEIFEQDIIIEDVFTPVLGASTIVSVVFFTVFVVSSVILYNKKFNIE
ncbi:MAG: hypothetical protein ACI4E1_05465 [Lachnospira sp.]